MILRDGFPIMRLLSGGIMEKIFFEGFSLQASLIFALGAQNIFVLESGLRKTHSLTISLVCFLCDLTLIMMGVAGAATVFNLFPSLKFAIGIIGVIFLFLYGLQKFTEESSFSSEKEFTELSLKKSALLAMTFSLVNPHAYLDAFVLIGGYSSKYVELNERLSLGFGAAIYSGLWFLVLSYFSGFMKPLFSDKKRMKIISVCTGSFLMFLSGKLSMDILSWLPPGIDLSQYQITFTPANNLILYSSILY